MSKSYYWEEKFPLNGRTWRHRGPARNETDHNVFVVRDNGVVHVVCGPGDRHAAAETSPNTDRVEVHEMGSATAKGLFQPLTYNVPIWLSYAFRIPADSYFGEPGQSPVSAGLSIVGQFHPTEDAGDVALSPSLAFYIGHRTWTITTRHSFDNPVTTNPPTVIRYSMTVKDNQWYRVVLKVVFRSGSNGELQVWVDGRQVLNLDSVPLGFDQAIGPWFAYGIYRPEGQVYLSDGVSKMDYAHVELSYSDLSDRIANPKPVPESGFGTHRLISERLVRIDRRNL